VKKRKEEGQLDVELVLPRKLVLGNLYIKKKKKKKFILKKKKLKKKKKKKKKKK